jgi:hypothetical protein
MSAATVEAVDDTTMHLALHATARAGSSRGSVGRECYRIRNAAGKRALRSFPQRPKEIDAMQSVLAVSAGGLQTQDTGQ